MSYWSERNSRGASAENFLESLQKQQLGRTLRGLCEVSVLLFPLLSLLVGEKMIKEAPTLLTQDFFLVLFNEASVALSRINVVYFMCCQLLRLFLGY